MFYKKDVSFISCMKRKRPSVKNIIWSGKSQYQKSRGIFACLIAGNSVMADKWNLLDVMNSYFVQ